jgi:hypothetical protein
LFGNAKKPEKMNDEDSEEMDEEAISAICLDLGVEVIHNILEAQTTKQI